MIYTTLDNFYLTKEQLENSPSRADGVDAATERQLRVYGCQLVQEAGILLRLPQAAMATGQVLLQRFYCKRSMVTNRVKDVAAAAIFLASKLEEVPRRLREVVSVMHRLDLRKREAKIEPLDIYSKAYDDRKNMVNRAERYMLRAFGFIMHVEHPHKFVLNYLQLLGQGACKEVMQEAWNLCNDSLRSTLCLRFKAEVVACGIIYMAARRLKVPLPETPPWWDLFCVKLEDIVEVCCDIQALYSMPKADYISLPLEPLRPAHPSAVHAASPSMSVGTPAASAATPGLPAANGEASARGAASVGQPGDSAEKPRSSGEPVHATNGAVESAKEAEMLQAPPQSVERSRDSAQQVSSGARDSQRDREQPEQRADRSQHGRDRERDRGRDRRHERSERERADMDLPVRDGYERQQQQDGTDQLDRAASERRERSRDVSAGREHKARAEHDGRSERSDRSDRQQERADRPADRPVRGGERIHWETERSDRERDSGRSRERDDRRARNGDSGRSHESAADHRKRVRDADYPRTKGSGAGESGHTEEERAYRRSRYPDADGPGYSREPRAQDPRDRWGH